MTTLRYLALFIGWNLLVSAAVLMLPPLIGISAALLLYAALLRGFLLRETPRARRRRALTRLRPLAGAALRWTVVAVPVLIMLTWALEGVYLRLVPVPVESLDPLGPLMETPGGTLAVAVLAVGIAPFVEEVFFRGLIQRRLELKYGGARGVIFAAALFGAVHLLPWVLPLHFFLGMVFGFAVYATRSIWAGVILHAVNNAAALLGLSVQGEPMERVPTVWEAGLTPGLWFSLALLAVSGAATIWIARRLWWAGRGAPTF